MDIAIRSAVIFAFLLLLTRVIGRRELSSLEPFDLILLVVIGDFVQQGVTQSDYSLTGAVIAVGTLAVLQVGTSWVAFRFRSARIVLDGEPIVVVHDGKPIEHNLRRERLSVDEVLEEARLNQIASLDEIRLAVVETSGNISFLKKQ